MKKKSEFRIVSAAILDDLVTLVNNAIKEGYEPFGSIFTVPNPTPGGVPFYCQPIIKNKKK